MGPFAYMDLVGIDVNLAAATAIYEAFGAERFRPSPLQVALVEEGRLGRKAGRGFYRYEEGRAPVAEPVRPAGAGDALQADEIVERIQLAITNEAFRALADRVATAPDIDLALQRGANHPEGPLARADRIGRAEVRRRLEALAATEGERFLPAPGIAEGS
jgi:3-hydroxyacyl-CoA dehydrogenase